MAQLDSDLFARSCKSPSARFRLIFASNIGGSMPISSLRVLLLPVVCLLDDERIVDLCDCGLPVLAHFESIMLRLFWGRRL